MSQYIPSFLLKLGIQKRVTVTHIFCIVFSYREPAVEELVLVDGGEALCDPRDGVAGLALAQHLAAEHRRVRISCGEEQRREES